MAIVYNVTAEMIEKLRGVIDFYMLRGILPVARSWPKKPKPPYTDLQAESMAVFAIANGLFSRLTPNMVAEWRSGTVGKRPAWTDVFRSLIMKYWKITRGIAPVATDYKIVTTGISFTVEWDILQVYIDPKTPEENYKVITKIINIEDILLAPKPIYFTLLDDDGNRLVAPNISLEDKI